MSTGKEGIDNMKVYLLVECAGEWEDYREHVLKGYTKREAAENEKVTLEKTEQILREQSKKCAECDLYWNSIPDTTGYCEFSSKAEWKDNEVIGCSYHFTSYRYCVTYRIDEIEVEE